MRYFHWKTAIVSVIIFVLPIFFYPVSGAMTDGVTTYSYGFPSKWLSLQFQNQGGRLFGFELFGAHIVGVDISILTALLDLLIIYFVLTAFVKVFWINHFSIKFSNWREKRYYKKQGITPTETEENIVYVNYNIIYSDKDCEDDHYRNVSESEINNQEENHKKYSCAHEEAFQQEEMENAETNRTA